MVSVSKKMAAMGVDSGVSVAIIPLGTPAYGLTSPLFG